VGGSSPFVGNPGQAGSVLAVYPGFEALPNILTLSASDIAEDHPSETPIGTLSTADSTGGGPFTYSLVSGIGDDGNPSFSISGDQLVSNRIFDFEHKSSYSVRVRSTDVNAVMDGDTQQAVVTATFADA